MGKNKCYHLTLGRNGAEDEIIIHSPQGKSLAFIWFWDEKNGPTATEAKASAKLIVDALNAYDPAGEKSRQATLRSHACAGQEPAQGKMATRMRRTA